MNSSYWQKCPTCQTWHDPRTSSKECPHLWTAPEPPTLKAMREAGPPYVRKFFSQEQQ